MSAGVLIPGAALIYGLVPASAATAGPITGLGGKCIDIASAGTANGTLVDLYPCNGTGAQSWTHESNGELVNTNSGKCLDDNGFGGSGTQVQIWTCADSYNQQWSIP